MSLLVLVFIIGSAALGTYLYGELEKTPVAGQGQIQLSDITLEHQSGQLQLRADARIRLPRTVQEGLDSGVPLTFVLNFHLSEQRRFWLDIPVFTAKRHYTLTYYELTRHYRVSELETDVSRSFRSLSSALDGLGQLGRMTFELDEQQDARLAQPGLIAELDMHLSRSALPLPLQPIIRSSWTLASEEYRWPAI